MNSLPPDQREALEKARRHFGHCWKRELGYCWERASYPVELRDVEADLQRVRNTIGRRGLYRLK